MQANMVKNRVPLQVTNAQPVTAASGGAIMDLGHVIPVLPVLLADGVLDLPQEVLPIAHTVMLESGACLLAPALRDFASHALMVNGVIIRVLTQVNCVVIVYLAHGAVWKRLFLRAHV